MLHALILVAALPSVAALRLAVPRTPTEMVDMAAAAVSAARETGKNRLVVDLIVPQLDSEEVYGFFTEGSVPTGFIVKPEDLDPWPGGLKQQYPFAVDLAASARGRSSRAAPRSRTRSWTPKMHADC